MAFPSNRYARENLALANIYIKDPAVTLIKRDQKIPVIWFVANVGGILGLTMGCSLVTLFEVLHHVVLIFLKTGKRSVSKIQRTIKLSSSQGEVSGGRKKAIEKKLPIKGKKEMLLNVK